MTRSICINLIRFHPSRKLLDMGHEINILTLQYNELLRFFPPPAVSLVLLCLICILKPENNQERQ
jgi:hypothetical protein